MVVIFPDHTLELQDPIFSNEIETKITGIQKLEKNQDLKDTQIIKMAVWNMVSGTNQTGKFDEKFYLIEVEILNEKLRSFTRLPISTQGMDFIILSVNWMDCFYKIIPPELELYCFANVETKLADTEETQSRSILLKKVKTNEKVHEGNVPNNSKISSNQEKLQVVAEMNNMQHSILKFSKNPLALEKDSDFTSKNILIYDTKTKDNRRCLIGQDFDFEKVETYFKICGDT
jgi:hypothetical protein